MDHFRSDEEVMTAVEEWVNGKDPDFFSSGLMALEHRWSKCITLDGNYIEKKRWISTGNKLGWLPIDSPSYYQGLRFPQIISSRKHAYIILTPLNPTFI